MANTVMPIIQASYQKTDVICCAGKKTNAMPADVVINPHRPAANNVPRPYRPEASFIQPNFTNAANM